MPPERGTIMKLSTNIMRFYQALGIEKTIDVFAAAGFQGIDFNADQEEYYTDVHGPDFYKELRAYAADKGIGFYQTHAPFRCSFPEAEKTEQRFWEIVKSMEHSALLGAEMTVVHPCNHFNNAQQITRDFLMEYNYNFYKRLLPYAEANGLKIAIENIHNYITAEPEGLLELLNALDNDTFTVCFDVGHAKLAKQDPAEMIRRLDGRIGCTHVHDNDGVNDLHTIPYYYGTIDWEEVMKALAETGYEGNLNYEASRIVTYVPNDFLLQGAKYMAQVGQYLIDRFNYYKG